MKYLFISLFIIIASFTTFLLYRTEKKLSTGNNETKAIDSLLKEAQYKPAVNKVDSEDIYFVKIELYHDSSMQMFYKGMEVLSSGDEKGAKRYLHKEMRFRDSFELYAKIMQEYNKKQK